MLALAIPSADSNYNLHVQVYSIVKLSRLCNDQGHNKQEKNRYLRELNGVMNLAKTMQLNFSSSPKPYRRGPLDKGAKQRIEQLLKLGYLIVKRPKSTPPIPPLYPPWKGKPIYGPSSATPQVQPLPSRAAATAASSSGAVPFIPGPAVAPVSLRLIQPPNSQVPTTSTFASVPLSPASMPASVPALLPSSAQALNVSAGFAPFPTQIAPLCLLPSSAPTPASLPSALSHLAHASDRVNPIQPISGPSSSGHSQLPLSPPAVPTAASQPSSSDATATLTLPPSQDTTAALVAAVGPVFEAFVAQTAAVVESPDMPVQALIAQVTQHLAAAIATAALQVVDARRQQGSAVIPFAEPLCITNPDMTQSAKPNTGAAKPQASQDVMRPHHTFDAEQLPHLTRLPGVSKPAQAETDVARLPSSDASVIDVIEKPAVACLSVAAPSEEKVKSLGSKQKTGSQGSLANKTSDDTQAKASKQVNSDEGKSRKSSGGRNVSNSPPSVSTLGQASVLPKTESQGKVSDAAPGTSKPVAASAGMKDSHGHAIQDKGKDSKKRSMTESTHDASRPAKRPHQLKAASGNSIEHEGYVVPGINASKYETGKHKSQVDTRSRHSAGAHQQGSRDVVSRSGSPRSSKSSGRSSPKDFRPLGASDFDSSRGSRHGSRSPRELSRLNGGSKSHRSQSMQEGSRRDVPAMPSRMSGAYGPGLSPDLPSVLPFEPAVDISLCQGFGAPDFRPVGLHHGNGGGWQQQDPSLFRPLPIPDISFAPDFTPHFCPGGPAN